MHHIVEAPKPNRASVHPISRRALLEGSSAGFVAAVGGFVAVVIAVLTGFGIEAKGIR